MKDDSNTEPSAKILSFPTEQRRVSVATERGQSLIFTSEDLLNLLETSDVNDLMEINFDDINLTIKNDHNSFTYNWDEFMNGVDLSKNDVSIFSRSDRPYTDVLETVTELLVLVHKLNHKSQDGMLDELNYQLKDMVSWLIKETDNKSD
jgi:hypothetical protein